MIVTFISLYGVIKSDWEEITRMAQARNEVTRRLSEEIDSELQAALLNGHVQDVQILQQSDNEQPSST